MWLRCRASITVPVSYFLLLGLRHAAYAAPCMCLRLRLTRTLLCSEQVTNLTFLPALEATTGIPTGLSTDFTKPFISQLKINGEPHDHPAHSPREKLQSSRRAALPRG